MRSELKTVERASRGDLTGLNFIGLARLSHEPDHDKERPAIPLRGTDFSNREEHIRLNQEFIQSLGGIYLGTVDEPDTSAWKKKRIKQPDGTYIYRVIRPKYEMALADLKLGYIKNLTEIAPVGTPVHGMVFPRDDRLVRDPRQLEDAIEVVEYYDRPIIDVKGSLDLLTKNGRNMARMRVTMLKDQSDSASERMADSHYARAIRGIPVGGNRAFGWANDKRTFILREAALIRKAARDVLKGVAAYTICSKWTEKGIVTPEGNPWQRRAFVLMITSPRMVGWRVYGPADKPLHERYLKDADGNPVRGQWEPILDEPTWRAVVEILVGPDRSKTQQEVGVIKYFLAGGRIVCGVCGGKLAGGAKPYGRFDYACKPPAVDGGCGKVCGSGIAIDELITQLLHARLAQQEIIVEATPWPKLEDLEQLKQTKANLLAQFKENPDMGSYIWPKIRETDTAISKLNKERTAYTRKTATSKQQNIIQAWSDLAMEQRRAIFDEQIEVVILDPATRPSNRFDPARLRVVWRQESPQSVATEPASGVGQLQSVD